MGLIVGALWGLTAAWTAAASPPDTSEARPSFEALLQESAELADRGEFSGSLERSVASYESMPPDLAVGDLGRFVVEQAVDAFRRGAQAPDDVEATLGLLRRHLTDLREAREAGHPTVRADARESDLAAVRDALALALRPDPAPSATADARLAAPPPSRMPVAAPTPVDDVTTRSTSSSPPSPRDSRWRGIGMLTSGSLLAGGSIPLLVQGLRFPALVETSEQQARAVLAREMQLDPTLTIDEDAWSEHEVRQKRIGYALVGTGAAMLVVGVALVAWGGVRARRFQRATVSVAPAGGVVVEF